MSDEHSKASKARWVGISAEDRKKRMSAVAGARWSKMSKEDRIAYAFKMVEARKIIRLNKKNNENINSGGQS